MPRSAPASNSLITEFYLFAGADLGFPRGGSKFLSTLFKVDQIDIPSTDIEKKNRQKRGVLKLFLENFDKKLRFFGAHSP